MDFVTTVCSYHKALKGKWNDLKRDCIHTFTSVITIPLFSTWFVGSISLKLESVLVKLPRPSAILQQQICYFFHLQILEHHCRQWRTAEYVLRFYLYITAPLVYMISGAVSSFAALSFKAGVIVLMYMFCQRFGNKIVLISYPHLGVHDHWFSISSLTEYWIHKQIFFVDLYW